MILYILPDILGVVPELRGETFQIMVPFEPIANILARRRLFSVGGVQSARIRAGVSSSQLIDHYIDFFGANETSRP